MSSRGRALRILAACLKTGSRLDAGWLAAVTERDWQQALALANEQLITPTLRQALGSHRNILPTEVAEYLDYIHVLNCRRNRYIRRQAFELVRALNGIGIEPMLLKGVLMTLFEHRLGVGTRMMADIDVVIPPSRRADAIEVMKHLGYKARHIFPPGHHAVGEFARDGDPAAVDLHLELVDQSYILPAAEVWARATRAKTPGGGISCVPHPTHRVLHNILHAQVHYRGGFYLGELDLRQLYELAYLTRTYGDTVDWTLIEERMKRHRLGVALQSYLRNARVLTGLAWPIGEPLSWRAAFHAWRCRVQNEYSMLRQAAVPWGNLRAAFAWDRMAALHRNQGGSPLGWRLRHLRSVVSRHDASFLVKRLFRF